jgi:hypothetical protein
MAWISFYAGLVVGGLLLVAGLALWFLRRDAEE